jgi:coenzyme F420-reducing hydrogenase gamma subunit
MKENKIRIAIISLTGCEGCCFAILDWPKKFLALRTKIEINNFRLFEEDVHFNAEKFDIAFIEGSPLTKADVDRLKEVRQNSKTLIALGSCADMGGIYHLKKYQDKNKIFDHVYNGEQGIDNFDVLPISELVKVDYVIPGCPITADEFFNFVYQLLIGKFPIIKQNPVCYECQVRGFECVLQNNELCLGPITQGGCEAICLKSKQGCWGCRGLVEDAEVGNLVKKLKEKRSEKEIIKAFEIFGIKEQINV